MRYYMINSLVLYEIQKSNFQFRKLYFLYMIRSIQQIWLNVINILNYLFIKGFFKDYTFEVKSVGEINLIIEIVYFQGRFLFRGKVLQESQVKNLGRSSSKFFFFLFEQRGIIELMKSVDF